MLHCKPAKIIINNSRSDWFSKANTLVWAEPCARSAELKMLSFWAGGIFWKAILDKSGRVFLGRSRTLSDGREFSRTVEIFLGRSRFFSDGREFSRTVENFLGRSRIFWDGRDFSRTVEIFLGRSRFFSDGREFSRTVEILNFSRSVEIFSRTLQLFLQFDYVAEKLRISGTVDVSG